VNKFLFNLIKMAKRSASVKSSTVKRSASVKKGGKPSASVKRSASVKKGGKTQRRRRGGMYGY
jgi:hypothetical protein